MNKLKHLVDENLIMNLLNINNFQYVGQFEMNNVIYEFGINIMTSNVVTTIQSSASLHILLMEFALSTHREEEVKLRKLLTAGENLDDIDYAALLVSHVIIKIKQNYLTKFEHLSYTREIHRKEKTVLNYALNFLVHQMFPLPATHMIDLCTIQDPIN